MKKIGGWVVALALAVAPQLAHAENGVTEGAKSLSFAIPNGGNGYANGAAGIWMVMGTMNIGANVGLAYDNDASTWDVLLAPAVKMYTSTEGSVLPFWLGQVNLRLHDTGNTDPGVAVIGGMGLEWFATKNFSLSGHVGLGLDILRDDGKDPGKLGTITSALTAQIYQ